MIGQELLLVWLLEVAKEMKILMVLTADVSTSAGLDRLKKLFQKNILMLELLNKI